MLTVAVAFFFSEKADAQNRKYPETVVRGIVTDSVTGEPLPFVNIYLKGSDLGVTADKDGRFELATDKNFVALQISSLGYATKDFYVKKGEVNDNMNMRLAPAGTMLEEVVVTKKSKQKYSKKNNPAVILMERIRKESPKYDPRNHDYFNYDKYEKMVFALNDFSPEQKKNWFTKKFSFIFEFCDTSEVSGKPILPISVKEKASRILHRKDPGAQKEIVKGFKRDGIDDVFDDESKIGRAHV